MTTSTVVDQGATRQHPTSSTPRPVARDIVVIGASAGGVEALKAVVAALPEDYPGSVFVVLHIPPSVPSVLATILRRVTRLRCVTATDAMPIEPGTIYVTPPNVHLLLEPGRVRLAPGPRENGHRPAVDPLFRSAAAAYGDRVVGVVLTGNLDDGTRGLLAIAHFGGTAVVQDPDDANFPGMPQSAIANVPVQHVLPAQSIGELLDTFARPTPVTSPTRESEELTRMPDDGSMTPEDARADHESPTQPPPALPRFGAAHADSSSAENGTARHPDDRPPARGTERAVERVADLATGIGVVDGGARINESLGGTLSAFTCPECHGALWELHEGTLVRYRCRVGHAYTDWGLVDNKARSVEDALWTALTALEESAAIAARMAQRATDHGRSRSAETFRQRAEYLERRGAVLRAVLNELPGHVDGI